MLLAFLNFFGDFCFVVYFRSPSKSNKALNTIAPQFSSWRCVKVYGGVGACKTYPWCVKELSLKQVGVNSCEPFISLTDMYINMHTYACIRVYKYTPHLSSPHFRGSLWEYCTVRVIPSMKTTPIPLLTPSVTSD